MKRSGRHASRRLDESDLPQWARNLEVGCLRSVVRDVFEAKARADDYSAASNASCANMYAAAEKELDRLEDDNLSVVARSEAGLRAARKFWQAKVCARGSR